MADHGRAGRRCGDEAPLLLRDPLVVDFVTSADARRERSLENALVADITRFAARRAAELSHTATNPRLRLSMK